MKRYLMAQRQVYSCAAGLMAVVAVIPEGHAASALPLRDGEYATACTGGVPDIMASIGYHKGVLSPQGEGQLGYCPVRNVKAVGRVYSGSSNCHEEGTRIFSPAGTYRFSYTILSETSFLSKGKTYQWCGWSR